MNSPALSPATRRIILLLSFATFASMMAQRIYALVAKGSLAKNPVTPLSSNE